LRLKGTANHGVFFYVREIEQFRVIYNARIEYYRQLQLLSVKSLYITAYCKDTVENYNGVDPDADLEKLNQIETQIQPKIAKNLARRRYLEELKSWETKVSQDRLCVICQSTFDVGALTKCGHLFCISCLQIWLRSHHTCPVCKERLSHNDWHKIATQRVDIVLRGADSSHEDHSHSEAIYRT
jgi:E3 ubiquitin-protein ligase SHPRH